MLEIFHNETQTVVTEKTISKVQTLPQQTLSKSSTGLLVTEELGQALKTCKEKVERIAAECRASNRKFRDIEFDLQNDSIRCQFGLETQSKSVADVRRVTEIFERPEFFKDSHPSSNDIIQGALGDCWFLSALATMSSAPGLIEKLCIARDEEVGVYGFIFFKNDHWVDSIIDDQLFWSLPKYDELRKEEQFLYHEDKELYDKLSKIGGKGLLYARSGTSGETWVPLIEKAYAKLHGDYESLMGGLASEAIEDLTGGVSTIFRINDILDADRFWNEELLHANDSTRLFSASFLKLDTERSGNLLPIVKGLFGGHSYSILRVKEYHGKRFIVLRNPWGHYEWNGPWSDGSKEWTSEWFDLLDELDHVLGDDGEFVMEYADFLETWEILERTIIFDPSWLMSSHWMRIPPRPPLHPWTYGDIIFHFTLPKPSKAILVLSRLDDRYFDGIESIIFHHLEFTVYKRGQREPCGETCSMAFWLKSASCEVDLEAGDYVVFPRIDRYRIKDMGYYEENVKKWNERKLSRKLSERTESHSIAQNYEIGDREKHRAVSLTTAIAQCLSKTHQNTLSSKATPPASTSDVASNSTAAQPKSGDEDEMALYLGLRVYTKDEAVVTITSVLGR